MQRHHLLLLVHVHLTVLLLGELFVTVMLLTDRSFDALHLLRRHLLLLHLLLLHPLQTIPACSCSFALFVCADRIWLHVDRDYQCGKSVAAHDSSIVHDVLRCDLPASIYWYLNMGPWIK